MLMLLNNPLKHLELNKATVLERKVSLSFNFFLPFNVA